MPKNERTIQRRFNTDAPFEKDPARQLGSLHGVRGEGRRIFAGVKPIF